MLSVTTAIPCNCCCPRVQLVSRIRDTSAGATTLIRVVIHATNPAEAVRRLSHVTRITVALHAKLCRAAGEGIC